MPDQNWFVVSALPMIRSFVPLVLRHDVFARKTDVPPSKVKLRSVLSMLTLSDTVIVPGLLFQVKPCLPFW